MTPLDIAYLTALGGAAPWLARRALSRGSARVVEKWTGRVALPAKSRPRVWFHGVSVGEIHLLRSLLPAFSRHRPDVEAVVSSTTDTGLAEAEKLGTSCVAWPFDFSWSARAAIRNVQPDLIVLAESELWPGMLLESSRAGIPVVVINGRMSPRSAARWAKAGPLARMIFGRVAGFAVQTPEYASGLRTCGVSDARIDVTGSIKYDGVETDRANADTRRLRELFGIHSDETVWVAGSTQSPEERECVAIYRELSRRCPRLRLIIVPRQKDRFDDVVAEVERQGVTVARRSRLPGPPAPVIVVDTIGELRAVWGLADIAFVGGSLDGKRGGQNMIEPAAAGAAVTFGPHVWNFRSTVESILAAGGAIQVRDFADLARVTGELLSADRRRPLVTAGRTFVAAQQGATLRTLAFLDKFLPARPAAAA